MKPMYWVYALVIIGLLGLLASGYIVLQRSKDKGLSRTRMRIAPLVFLGVLSLADIGLALYIFMDVQLQLQFIP